MTDWRDIEAQVHDLLDGRLDARQERELRALLDREPAHARRFRELEALVRGLHGLQSETAPSGFADRVLARIGGGAPAAPDARALRPRRRTWTLPWVAALAAGLLLAVALALREEAFAPVPTLEAQAPAPGLLDFDDSFEKGGTAHGDGLEAKAPAPAESPEPAAGRAEREDAGDAGALDPATQRRGAGYGAESKSGEDGPVQDSGSPPLGELLDALAPALPSRDRARGAEAKPTAGPATGAAKKGRTTPPEVPKERLKNPQNDTSAPPGTESGKDDGGALRDRAGFAATGAWSFDDASALVLRLGSRAPHDADAGPVAADGEDSRRALEDKSAKAVSPRAGVRPVPWDVLLGAARGANKRQKLGDDDTAADAVERKDVEGRPGDAPRSETAWSEALARAPGPLGRIAALYPERVRIVELDAAQYAALLERATGQGWIARRLDPGVPAWVPAPLATGGTGGTLEGATPAFTVVVVVED